jgi:hypothetical protein
MPEQPLTLFVIQTMPLIGFLPARVIWGAIVLGAFSYAFCCDDPFSEANNEPWAVSPRMSVKSAITNKAAKTAFAGTIRRGNPEFESGRGRLHQSLHSEDTEDASDFSCLL